MLAESRTTIKSWIERIVGSDVSVFCDFVPDYESSQSVVCFNLQDVELTRTLDMSSTLFWATVKIIISSRNRADADAVVDSLLDQSFDDDETSGIKNIFFESLHDLDFDPAFSSAQPADWREPHALFSVRVHPPDRPGF